MRYVSLAAKPGSGLTPSRRIVVVARDTAVAGSFVQGDRIGKGAVGIEPNSLVALLGSRGFKVAQQPRAEPGSSSCRMDPHALDLTSRAGQLLTPSATNRQAIKVA